MSTEIDKLLHNKSHSSLECELKVFIQLGSVKWLKLKWNHKISSRIYFPRFEIVISILFLFAVFKALLSKSKKVVPVGVAW